MKTRLWLFLKGAAMGAANVIPGVSGGTIAFITGIYEPFINSLKSIDGRAVKLLITGNFRAFAAHVNLAFLLVLSLGIAFSLISLGKLLDFLFAQYPVYVWAFFFGLIAISIVSVGRTIRQWNAVTWTWFVIGTGLAVWLSFLKPAGQNDHTLYLVLCGTVAMASMILPGLSGSFVLILMGNYRLVMLEAVPSLNMTVLLPVVGGALIGFVLLSRIINYLLKFRHDQTIATLTGFILGSLLIIWPWKNEILLTDPETGTAIIRDGQEVVQGYEWFLPQMSIQTGIAAAFILIGIAIVLAIEHISRQQ